jgi:hypothetical protein
MNIRRLARISLGRLRPRLSANHLVAAAPFFFLCASVAQAQDPQLVPVLQGLLHKYKGCILERYETQQDMINRGMDRRLSNLKSAAGLQPRDRGVQCAAGNVCTLASRQAMYAILEAQANRGDNRNFETNLQQAIPRDCFPCQKHQELHTKHVHCTMDCGGNNGLTKGPCFEGCKAGVDVTRVVNDIISDIHEVLQASVRHGGNPAAGPTDPRLGSGDASHPRPLDLVWDVKTGVDANSLPLNPLWHFQVDHPGQLPDFKTTCGPAFLPDYERNLDESMLAAICTSQSPTLDVPKQDIPCGLSNKKVLVGHLNWGIATEVGTIYWSEDSNDGDFNFELTRPDNAAQTTLNAPPEYGLHLEFKESETVKNFRSPFWVSFYNGIESLSSSDKRAAMNSIEGKPAVVTGLIGIDGVHGGYTESHPVYSLAIQTAEQAVPGGIDATWAFFLRNSGGEGCCSSLIHHWNGLKEGNTPGNWYFIQLPSPWGATSVTVQASATQVWANQAGMIGPVITRDSQWTYLGFRLPDPALGPVLDGEISLHYAVSSRTAPQTKMRPTTPVLKARIPRGDEWEEVRNRMRNPEDQKRLDETLRASQLAEKSRPHTVRLAVAASASIPPHQPIPGPGHNGVLIRTTAVPDPSDAASREQLDQNVRKIVPREMVQPIRR